MRRITQSLRTRVCVPARNVSSLNAATRHAVERDASLSHPDPGPDSPSAALIESHSPYLLTTYSRPPLIIDRGQGAYIWDVEDRKYIDFTAGIAVTALGHADPEVTQVIYDQARQLIHASNLYHNPWAGELAKLIVERTKAEGSMSGASKIFFANSGGEANEAAIKFARKVGKHRGGNEKFGMVSFNNAFHGRTMGALSATNNPKYQAPFAPMVPGFTYATLNDTASLQSVITDITCGVIVEPIQGEGGIFECTPDFMVALRKRCDEVGACLIFDEIQCGLGRTGSIWAHASMPKQCHPDILTMAKPLANGVPIGATMVTEAVADAIKIGDHGTTFGGNPLACRVAHHVFSRLSKPEVLQHVKKIGAIMLQHLTRLKEQYPDLISEVRGRGLILGLAMKFDPSPIVKACRERGMLIITAGNQTLRFVPPLIIEEHTVIEGLTILEAALQEIAKTSNHD